MNSYHPLIRYLHGALIGLISLQFFLGWVMPELGRQSPTITSSLHFSFGIVELFVAVMLIIGRIFVGRQPSSGGSPLSEMAANLMHLSLYTLAIVVPISGYLWLSRHAISVKLFMLVPLPLVSSSNSITGLGAIHSALTTLLGTLVLGHAGAALYHHFVLRDQTLVRMFRHS